MDISAQDLQDTVTQRLKIDLVAERLEDALNTLASHISMDPSSAHQSIESEARPDSKQPADQALPSTGLPLDKLSSIANEASITPKRRSGAGPRRLVPALESNNASNEQEAGDLGGQLMHPSDVLLPSQTSPSPASKSSATARRFVPIRRKAVSPAVKSPAFMDALTSLLSPSIPSPSQSPFPESPESASTTGILGLGISDGSLHGLGISDVRSPILGLKNDVVQVVEELASVQPTGLFGSADEPSGSPLERLTEFNPSSATALSEAAVLPTGPSLIPNLLSRRSGSRRSLRRRTVGPMDTPASTGQAPYSPSLYSPSAYYSPTPTYSPIPYTSSPLVSAWSSPTPSSYYSPSLYESPVPTFGSSPFLVYNAASPTSTYCPPNATTTASPLASSSAVISPIITSSPLLGTPLTTDSPVFSSPSFGNDPEAFESTANVVQASAATSSATPFAQSANDMSSSSLLTVQAVVSGLMSVILFFACCLAAWLLVRRRKPKQLPTISSPLPQIEYKGGDDPDDDLESKFEVQGPHTRHSEVPTLPESVLPARLWRNSTASNSGGLSEFRKSVEEGLGNLGMNKLAGSPGQNRTSTQSAGEQQGTGDHGSHYRSPSLPYRPQRYSSLPNIQSMPATPSASYSSFDRTTRHSTISNAESSRAVPDDWDREGSDASDTPVLRVVNTDIVPEEQDRPASPTTSIRSKASTKSSKSTKQQMWALRKTAIIASASSSAKKEVRPMDISLPLGRPSKIQATRDTEALGHWADISNSVNMVLLDTEFNASEQPLAKQVEHSRPRPLSQDAVFPKNKLRKRSSSLGAPKSRPATIGHTPPAIFVTDHPQALVPPPSPKVKRISTYSLSDTLPYTMSASPSMVSTHFGQLRDDCSFIDPDMHAYSEAYQPDSEMQEDSSSARPESMQSTTSSLSESCHSVDTMDLDTDDEQLRRSQRRRTLLYSVYRQSQSHPDGLSSWTTDSTRTVKVTEHDAPAQETPKRNQPKTDIVSSFPPVPLPPLTPPYTPVESRFPHSMESPSQQPETPSNRIRSVSAGAPKPVLDAALTRFSRLDLASEFSLSQFGSQASLKSISRDKDGKFVIPSSPPSLGRVDKHGLPAIPPRSPRRQSTYNPTSASSDEKAMAAPSTPARRARSSTVGDKPSFFSGPSPEAMMTASRIPLPSRSKATRVSVATAIPPPSPAPTMRSIAQDLRASVSFPSGYEVPVPRPSSIRSSYSSIGITSDYGRSSIIDFTHRPNSFELPQHQPHEMNFRSSNGSLTLPRLDEEDDDDRSVYSRDSGSHESAWELAKARVRARASLALPSAMEELV